MLALALFIAVAALFILVAVCLRQPVALEMPAKSDGASTNLPVFSPSDGTAVPLRDVPGATAAAGGPHRGLAIRPCSGSVFAPFDASVVAVHPTGHAMKLRHAAGAEVLIHIGVDSIEPNGEHFHLKVGINQQIKAGDLLVEFDHLAMEDAGNETFITIIVESTHLYSRIEPLAFGAISHGEALFMAIAVQKVG
ncbi:PTS glucose transporter subunit IIA [Microbacterium sp. VKM Ac-2923]|uniref:PTS sugar transporter subunit IIA n=1 Tax=Microbacterium sp. VKM Ac-2923 TaxID=2929476 RepID=UPI001FB46D3C|nr:PTS glucose transporter subunit IIA [Microbacterium sp. VKM Ac-2923]MCJ1709461.1 PTS glucose transporter subunit IIA [Microbacterium sp. VKM Ac-2923]